MTNESLNRLSQVVFMATCVALVALASVMVWRTQPTNVTPGLTATSVSKPVEAGTKLSQLDGVDFSKAPVTVALVLQSQCPYCAASMGFYKHLVEFKKDTPFQLVVTSMESTKTTESYLKERGLQADGISNLKPGQISTPGTPTLVLLDKRGVVVDSWIGQLSAAQEQEVTRRIKAAAKG